MDVRTCGLCSHTAPGDHSILGAQADGVDLCHSDDHSCYHRWTVMGARPDAQFPNPDAAEAYIYEHVLQVLALPYAAHPDYREEWRP
jgi:hypothetical protein